MSTIAKHFDVLDFVKKSKQLGASEELAEYQARQIEQAIDFAISQAREEIDAKELATKRDLKELELSNKRDLESTKNQIILWVAGLFLASGLLQHFFK